MDQNKSSTDSEISNIQAVSQRMPDEAQHGQLGTSQTPTKSPKKLKRSVQNIRKEARNSGQGYFSRKGNNISEKIFKFQYCKCLNKCEEIGEDERKALFKRFWCSSNWQCQANFIMSTVITSSPKRPSVKNSRILKSRSCTINGKQVCKLVYLNTLGVSNKRVDYCLNQKMKSGLSSPDKRGKVTPNKTSENIKERIKNFLDDILKYKSHYTNSDKLYFSPDLSRKILFNFYKEREIQNIHKLVSQPVFNNIFATYNIGLYVPKTDTCQFCDSTAMKLKTLEGEDKLECESARDKHHARAERALNSLREATARAKVGLSLLIFTFDMQKTQPLPRLNTSVVFYKRQLCVLNLGINTCHDNQGYMAMWCEH